MIYINHYVAHNYALPSDVQDEIILLLVEHQHAYEQHRNAEDGGVDYMIRIHRPAESTQSLNIETIE